MTDDTASVHGYYHDGRHPVGLAATLVLAARDAALIGPEISRKYAVSSLRVSPRVAGADRFIALPDGGQLQCVDDPQLDRLPQEIPSEGFVGWLEQRWGYALAGIALIVAMLSSGYFYGLPAAARHIAARIPIETEADIGKQALAWLDNNRWFTPSQVPHERQARLQSGFARLHQGLPLARHYRLELRHATFIGPNAFALPGGTIVLTDQMVAAARSQDEVLAVLAHEIGHVELRHTMRHVLQDSITAVIAATITGDAASLSVAVAGLPALLAQTKYSRDFEAEADEFAFRLLKQHGISPKAFASLMERLAKGHDKTERALGFVSTHPITAERVQRARAAAGQ
jgi:predicted Zn-dependent protease